jgi:methylated-DNA-[protein]-cysteine S-methyltransferase
MKDADKLTVVYTSTLDTPLGVMRVSAENEALTGLWFIGQKYYPINANDWVYEPGYFIFKSLKIWLSDYFSGLVSNSGFRLEPHGTAFQKVVWNLLLKIPYGYTTTYGEIAKKIVDARGIPSMSAQAVGGAVGHNPISILIPCHRVVGADQSLTGYAGGLDKKEALLKLERVYLTGFDEPPVPM